MAGNDRARRLAAGVEEPSKVPYHLRGVTKEEAEFVVVSQADVSDVPVPMMFCANEQDAKDYVSGMRVSGCAKGLRVVPASEVED